MYLRICLTAGSGDGVDISKNPFLMPPEKEIFTLREREKIKTREVCMRVCASIKFCVLCVQIHLFVSLKYVYTVCMDVCLFTCYRVTTIRGCEGF